MSLNLSISPAQIELIVKPGTKVTQAFDIRNLSDSPQIITASVLPWLPQGSDGLVTYNSVPTPSGIYFDLNNSNIRLNQPFRLKPRQAQQLVLKISSESSLVPTDAYYTLFITQNQSEIPSGSSSTLTGRLGAHLLLSFSSSQNLPQKTTAALTTSPPVKDIFLTPIYFSGKITNQDSHFTKSQGQIIISKNNQEITRLTLAPDNILANSSRFLRCLNLEKSPIPCRLSPPFWPGIYTASLGQTSLRFYILPISPLALLLSFIFIFLSARKIKKTIT